jgi:putative tryptophan/tyrosine transport system substrate-binding protein
LRWAENRDERLPALAADPVGRKVDGIAASGGDLSSLAAKSATSTIPIVSIIGGDPVAAGRVASLAQPGGNLTGVSFLIEELMPKRLELLSEIVLQAGVIVNSNNPNTEGIMRDVQEAARTRTPGWPWVMLSAWTYITRPLPPTYQSWELPRSGDRA